MIERLRWINTGGSLMEFSGFQGVYTAYIMSLMNHDVQLIRNAIVTSAMTVLLATGTAMYATALATAAIAGPLAYGQIASAQAMIAFATSQILVSNMQYIMALLTTVVMGAFSFMSAGVPRIAGVMQKQYEYEEAQAALNYFTKVPDVQTLKDRVIQWGATPDVTGERKDPYAITEEDLIYLFEEDGAGNANYLTSAGAAQTLTAEEQSEALNLTNFANNTQYKDIYGRAYDPNAIVYGVNGGRDGGYYYHNGEQYTRIQAMGHNGALTWAYAKVDTSGTQRRVYNMAAVMEMAVQHGQTLRDQRLNDYIAAGNAATADDTFKYQERDNTYQTLFENAAAEGRSYTGYQMTYTDYEGNQADVFGAELQQRQAVQIQEWDLREKELNDRYEEWQRKMDAILERGRNAWGNAENRYLQEWREWERKVDTEEREGNTKWDEQIAKHFTDKQQWEQDLRSKASEESIREVLTESVNSLNSQILMVRENIKNSTLSTINTTAYVNNAIAELQALQPSFSEQFENINANIANFKTKLSISELAGADLGSSVEVISAEYREELRDHEKNMQVQAKVKVFEEYRRMLDEFAFQIQLQNDAIAQQTAAAAMAQGFAPTGAAFVKMSNASGAVGLVNAYAYFEAEEIIDQELKNIGFEQRQGDELVDFLLDKDDVEVEAYFYTQKLALQHIFGVIMGTGDSEARKDSQDEKVIGKFGTWAGKQGGNTLTQAVDQVAGDFKDVQQFQDASLMSIARNFGGFGEQGSGGMRPGGAALGFYPQLELMNRMMGNADAGKFQGLRGSIDPFSAMMNQWNPMVMTMNSVMNVQLGAASGISTGYLIEAQLINAIKTPLSVIGNAMVFAGVATGWTGVGIVLAAVGTAVSALANSIQVDPTTGERATKMSDQAAINTAVGVGTSALGGFASGLQAGVAAAQAAGAPAVTVANMTQFASNVSTLATVSSIGSAGLQAGMQYDSKGNYQGMSFAGNAGTSAVLAMGTSFAASKIGGAISGQAGIPTSITSMSGSQMVASATIDHVVNSALNTGVEYYKHTNWGADQSGYTALARPDLSVMTGIAGAALGMQIKQSAALYSAEKQAREAQRQGNTAQAAGILAAAGFSEERRRRMLEGIIGGYDVDAGDGGFLEKAGNFLIGDGYKSDNEVAYFDTYGHNFCFPAGTTIAMASGFKEIQNIQVGDTVLAANEETGLRSNRKVLKLFQNTTDELVNIQLSSGETIRTTPKHPFWTRKRKFVPAGELTITDLLLDSGGCEVRILSIQRELVANVAVYNFEVETDHTYFVSSSRILVHNESDPTAFDIPAPKGAGDKFLGDQVKSINNKPRIEDPRHPEKGGFDRKEVRKDDGSLDYVYFEREVGKDRNRTKIVETIRFLDDGTVRQSIREANLGALVQPQKLLTGAGTTLGTYNKDGRLVREAQTQQQTAVAANQPASAPVTTQASVKQRTWGEYWQSWGDWLSGSSNAATNDPTVFNEDARERGIEFAEENRASLLAGNSYWSGGKKDGKAYNNILLPDENGAGNRLKVYRQYEKGRFTVTGTERITDVQYQQELAKSTGWNTYCNLASSPVSMAYGAPSMQYVEYPRGGYDQYNANSIYDRLAAGQYNTDTHQFAAVDFKAAERHASAGGLAVAVYKGQTGHIAVLTGGYDGQPGVGNLNIFQAGKEFGHMTYGEGFGSKSSRFYIWKRK